MRPLTAFLCAAVLLGQTASGRSPKPAAPVYDRATTIDIAGVIAELRDTPTGALPGLHLLVATEKKGDVDVYVGPGPFVKDFGFKFTRGEEVRATGSKTRCETGEVVLAREIRRHDVTVYLRDIDGKPLWTQ
ncbi:MAG TPA: hypothetical protein VFA04_15195 [Bryobacteraceae bacterium]|nr:hypothetical protein [Bryobacteraceae bacterium]